MSDTRSVPVRHHHLVKMADAPCFAQAALLGIEDEETREMAQGSAVHAMLFNTVLVVTPPDGMARRNDSKKYQEWAAEHDGCMIVTASEYKEASRLSEAIRAHREASKLIDGAELEVTRHFTWKGRICQATPDIGHVAKDYLADVKTTKSANPYDFAWQSQNLYYDSAMAWYRRALGVKDVYLICADKRAKAGFKEVVVYRVDDAALAEGAELHEQWFDQLLECERQGYWPGYSPSGGILTLKLPGRRKRVFEQVA